MPDQDPPPKRKIGRPLGSLTKDPQNAKHCKNFRARIIFNHAEKKRMEWVMKYFQCDPSQAIRMSVNMMCEMAQEFEKGSELYFERKIGSKMVKRRIIIT